MGAATFLYVVKPASDLFASICLAPAYLCEGDSLEHPDLPFLLLALAMLLACANEPIPRVTACGGDFPNQVTDDTA